MMSDDNVVVDVENNMIIINVPDNVSLNVISSALYSFVDKNYVFFDKDNIGKGFIVYIVPKNKQGVVRMNMLCENIVSQLNVYEIHKQKLDEKKQFVEFLTDLIIQTNDPKK